MYKEMGKRIFDLAVTLLVGTVAFPLIFISYILVRLSSPGPGFFMQERLGREGKKFKVFKLRTMSINPNRELTQTKNSDPDVFAFGKLLRRTKIDELPQIINVLKGEMSIVGPRPGLPSMLATMPEWAKARLSVRPGLTGLAQINGNIELTWEQRWAYDIRYVNGMSFMRDLSIIFKTVFVVIFGESYFRRLP